MVVRYLDHDQEYIMIFVYDGLRKDIEKIFQSFLSDIATFSNLLRLITCNTKQHHNNGLKRSLEHILKILFTEQFAHCIMLKWCSNSIDLFWIILLVYKFLRRESLEFDRHDRRHYL